MGREIANFIISLSGTSRMYSITGSPRIGEEYKSCYRNRNRRIWKCMQLFNYRYCFPVSLTTSRFQCNIPDLMPRNCLFCHCSSDAVPCRTFAHLSYRFGWVRNRRSTVQQHKSWIGAWKLLLLELLRVLKFMSSLMIKTDLWTRHWLRFAQSWTDNNSWRITAKMEPKQRTE